MADKTSEERVKNPDRDDRFRQQWVLWTLALLGFLFWDTLWGLLGSLFHLLLELFHILLEYLELLVEELLMEAFHLEEHDSQMATAWLGLGTLVVLLVWGYRLAVRQIRRRLRSWAYVRSWIKIHAQEHWLTLTVITGAYLAYLFLF